MAEMYDFLGQKIVIGDIVGDIAAYSTRLNYTTTPTYFNPIEYAKNNGGIPRTNHTYYFTSSLTGDEDPVFGIYFMYSGGRFRVGYCMRAYDHDTSTWTAWTDSPSIMHWGDGYAGADPDNITEEDGWKNGLYLTYITVSTLEEPNHNRVGESGFVLGHEDQATTHPVQYPTTSPYHLDENQVPPRYVYDDINLTYYMFDYAGYQIAYTYFGLEWALELIKEIDGSDDDDSGPAGGGGTYDFPTWGIGIGDLPNISIMDTGIATMWTPATAEIQSLVNFLWSDSFWDNIIKNCDPIENIIQVGIVPINLSAYAGTAKECKVGNVGTGVTMTPLTQQFITYDCGSVSIKEAFGACLDYSPSTHISCYAPYVGTFDLTPDEVMNCESLHMVYKIDLLTGDFVMLLTVTKMMPFPMSKKLDSVLYHKPGNLMTKIPVTGANYSKMYSQILQGIAGGVSAAAGGNIAGAVGSVAGIASSAYSFETQKSGQFTGSSAILGVEVPHLILTQPIQVKPARYGDFEGYATYITYRLGSLTGYVKVEAIIDDKISGATEREKAEIERLLKEGVYILDEDE